MEAQKKCGKLHKCLISSQARWRILAQESEKGDGEKKLMKWSLWMEQRFAVSSLMISASASWAQSFITASVAGQQEEK